MTQLEALGAVGQAESFSLNLTEVLNTIITQAVQLSGTDGGSIYEFDEDAREFRVETVCGTSPETFDALRRTRIGLDDTFLGKAAALGRPLELPDLRDAPLDPYLSVMAEGGWRSLVAVPMLRGGRIVGAMVVRRYTPGHVPQEICDLLGTFASQSALALINAQLYRQLERQSAALEVASRHKSEFLASMSHELRTPLNAIIGFSEVLLERMFGELNERQDDYLRDIWSSGKHLLELLNDILDLSKIEAGQMVLNRSEFAVRESLEYCLSMVRERALKQRILLSLEVDPAGRPARRRSPALQASRAESAVKRGEVHPRRGTRGCPRLHTWSGPRRAGGRHGTGCARLRTASASSTPSSKAPGSPGRPRAPGSGSPCPSGSSSCMGAGSGSKVKLGRAARSGSRCRPDPRDRR